MCLEVRSLIGERVVVVGYIVHNYCFNFILKQWTWTRYCKLHSMLPEIDSCLDIFCVLCIYMHQCFHRLMSMLKYLSVLLIYIIYFRQYSRRLDSHLVYFFSVLWIDIAYYNQYSRRLTARGHRDGSVVVTHVDVKNNGVYVLVYFKNTFKIYLFLQF